MRRDLFTNSGSHAIALGVACRKLLGVEWLEWEPRTVYEALKEKGLGQVTEENSQKISAYRVARCTLLPWTDPDTFEKTVHGLLGNIPNFSLREPLNIAQCMVGVDMLRAIQQLPFGRDVQAYIAACAQNDELDYLPDPLTFIMPLLCPPM